MNVSSLGPRARRCVGLVLTGLTIAGSTAIAGSTPAEAQVGCTPLHVVTARGTWEPQDAAFLLPQVVSKIRSSVGSSQVSAHDVRYAAQPAFFTSAPEGVTSLVNHLNSQGSSCPDQKFILLGYSQGALVTGDALVPANLRAFGGTGDVSQGVKDRIVGIGMFGSMRFTDGESYNAGSHQNGSGRQSTSPRTPGQLAEFEDRIIDYCYSGDWVCENTGSFLTHLIYIFDQWSQWEVAGFVADKYEAS